MKKTFLTLVAMLLCSSAAMAVEPECAWTADQNLIRTAEYVKDLNSLENQDARINAQNACGGSLLQLAILRGNPTNLNFLISNGAAVNKPVSIKGYEADFKKGTPQEIPLILFGARYATNGELFQKLLDAELDAKVQDSAGHDIFWYFDQNPVFRNTYIVQGGYEQLISTAKFFEQAKAKAAQIKAQ